MWKEELWKTQWSKCSPGYLSRLMKKSLRRQKLRPCNPCSWLKTHGPSAQPTNGIKISRVASWEVRRRFQPACACLPHFQYFPCVRGEWPTNASCRRSELRSNELLAVAPSGCRGLVSRAESVAERRQPSGTHERVRYYLLR